MVGINSLRFSRFHQINFLFGQLQDRAVAFAKTINKVYFSNLRVTDHYGVKLLGNTKQNSFSWFQKLINSTFH